MNAQQDPLVLLQGGHVGKAISETSEHFNTDPTLHKEASKQHATLSSPKSIYTNFPEAQRGSKFTLQGEFQTAF
eukprot:1475919-Amphidinium_carterae.1